jgi:PRTRC genetic system protein A
MNGLVDYQMLTGGAPFKFQQENGPLYTYLVGANGVFVAGMNEYFKAIIPVQPIRDPKRYVRGLEMIKPYIFISERVPNYLLQRMITTSRRAMPNEFLFHLDRDLITQSWMLTAPQQKCSPTSVRPLEDRDYVPLEVHSHNSMAAFFSETDNRDETGMRLYGVLGRVDQEVVEIRLRVSIYGHYALIPYHYVFTPHPGVQDAKD